MLPPNEFYGIPEEVLTEENKELLRSDPLVGHMLKCLHLDPQRDQDKFALILSQKTHDHELCTKLLMLYDIHPQLATPQNANRFDSMDQESFSALKMIQSAATLHEPRFTLMLLGSDKEQRIEAIQVLLTFASIPEKLTEDLFARIMAESERIDSTVFAAIIASLLNTAPHLVSNQNIDFLAQVLSTSHNESFDELISSSFSRLSRTTDLTALTDNQFKLLINTLSKQEAAFLSIPSPLESLCLLLEHCPEKFSTENIESLIRLSDSGVASYASVLFAEGIPMPELLECQPEVIVQRYLQHIAQTRALDLSTNEKLSDEQLARLLLSCPQIKQKMLDQMQETCSYQLIKDCQILSQLSFLAPQYFTEGFVQHVLGKDFFVASDNLVDAFNSIEKSYPEILTEEHARLMLDMGPRITKFAMLCEVLALLVLIDDEVFSKIAAVNKDDKIFNCLTYINKHTSVIVDKSLLMMLLEPDFKIGRFSDFLNHLESHNINHVWENRQDLERLMLLHREKKISFSHITRIINTENCSELLYQISALSEQDPDKIDMVLDILSELQINHSPLLKKKHLGETMQQLINVQDPEALSLALSSDACEDLTVDSNFLENLIASGPHALGFTQACYRIFRSSPEMLTPQTLDVLCQSGSSAKSTAAILLHEIVQEQMTPSDKDVLLGVVQKHPETVGAVEVILDHLYHYKAPDQVLYSTLSLLEENADNLISLAQVLDDINRLKVSHLPLEDFVEILKESDVSAELYRAQCFLPYLKAPASVFRQVREYCHSHPKEADYLSSAIQEMAQVSSTPINHSIVDMLISLGDKAVNIAPIYAKLAPLVNPFTLIEAVEALHKQSPTAIEEFNQALNLLYHRKILTSDNIDTLIQYAPSFEAISTALVCLNHQPQALLRAIDFIKDHPERAKDISVCLQALYSSFKNGDEKICVQGLNQIINSARHLKTLAQGLKHIDTDLMRRHPFYNSFQGLMISYPHLAASLAPLMSHYHDYIDKSFAQRLAEHPPTALELDNLLHGMHTLSKERYLSPEHFDLLLSSGQKATDAAHLLTRLKHFNQNGAAIMLPHDIARQTQAGAINISALRQSFDIWHRDGFIPTALADLIELKEHAPALSDALVALKLSPHFDTGQNYQKLLEIAPYGHDFRQCWLSLMQSSPRFMTQENIETLIEAPEKLHDLSRCFIALSGATPPLLSPELMQNFLQATDLHAIAQELHLLVCSEQLDVFIVARVIERTTNYEQLKSDALERMRSINPVEFAKIITEDYCLTAGLPPSDMHVIPKVLKRYLSENIDDRGGYQTVFESIEPLLRFIQQNPQHLNWVKEIMAHGDQGCVNQPVTATMECVAFMSVIESKDVQKISATRMIYAMDHIRNMVAEESHKNSKNHHQAVGAEVEVEAGNASLIMVNKEGGFNWPGVPQNIAYEGCVSSWISSHHDQLSAITKEINNTSNIKLTEFACHKHDYDFLLFKEIFPEEFAQISEKAQEERDSMIPLYRWLILCIPGDMLYSDALDDPAIDSMALKELFASFLETEPSEKNALFHQIVLEDISEEQLLERWTQEGRSEQSQQSLLSDLSDWRYALVDKVSRKMKDIENNYNEFLVDKMLEFGALIRKDPSLGELYLTLTGKIPLPESPSVTTEKWRDILQDPYADNTTVLIQKVIQGMTPYRKAQELSLLPSGAFNEIFHAYCQKKSSELMNHMRDLVSRPPSPFNNNPFEMNSGQLFPGLSEAQRQLKNERDYGSDNSS